MVENEDKQDLETRLEADLETETIVDGMEVDNVLARPAGAPEWTDMAEKNGLDPLGMQSLCISLYQSLVPGIANVTLRIRYYGFYAWLTWRYERAGASDSKDKWRQYIRRAEALCALVTLRGNLAETGISGAIWARKMLQQKSVVLKFREGTDLESGVAQYLKQNMGAFGAAYGAQVIEIGLLVPSTVNGIPVPSEIGQQMAQVFDDAVGACGDKFLEAAARGSVSLAELDALILMSLSKIPDTERDVYETLLLAPSTERAQDLKRRRTLELILRITDQLKKQVGALDIRWSAYSGLALNGASLVLPGSELEQHRYSWAVYHANDLLHMAYECLLKFSLQHLAKSAAGLRPQTLMSEVATAILTEWDIAPKTWSELEAETTLAQDAGSAYDPLSEYRLTEQVMFSSAVTAECTAESAKAAVLLLAVLSKRFSPEEARYRAVLGPLVTQDYVWSLYSELRFLQSSKLEPLPRTLQKLVLERVLERHLWVAFQKLHYRKDYTFLVESQDGILRTRKLDGPMLTNPRLGSAVDFLKDIRLVDLEGLTQAGRAALEQL
ncbi:hypothetical protein [Polaromonas naphthalenivorans]|uniref:Uncharacterized protein n=1 Tax=Polaromonas naphthalenivorans (strain CJ2) TaxID=365044 RepID=A1VWJ9_POLNA|nr:hypothetical protein [Polaromonas naphthalenivorans]ABM40027.1 hypothetical protein Pnap_4966 [Polaromonas naphthalenivorans CJ2]